MGLFRDYTEKGMQRDWVSRDQGDGEEARIEGAGAARVLHRGAGELSLG